MQNEDHRHWVKIMQNEEYRLQTRGEMREKTVGNTSALIEVSRNLFKSIYCGQNVCFFFSHSQTILRGKTVLLLN